MNGNDINAVGNGLYDVSFSQNDCFSSAYSSYLFTGCQHTEGLLMLVLKMRF